jgi:membrane-associated phospholipid phosphatase
MEQFFGSTVLFGEETLNQLHLFLGSWFDHFMAFVTGLGNESFYMLFIPIIYWCLHKELAARAGGAFLVGVMLNDYLKELFHSPRPDPANLSDGIKELNIKYIPSASFGFPSGHAQGTFVFWGAIAYYAGKKPVWLAAGIMVLLVSYSRLYLAVHFLGDVLGGLVFGLLVLVVYILALAWIQKRYERMKQAFVITAALILPYLLFKIVPGNEIAKTAGVFSGFIAGIIFERDRIGFSPRNGILQNVTKLVIGFIGVFAVKSGLKIVLPALPSSDYLRYWILGIWITLFAPYIFSKFAALRGSPSREAAS